MNTHQQTESSIATYWQVISIAVVSSLLILTAYGNAKVMFWFSLSGMFLISIWCLLDRKMWLAAVSVIAFLTTISIIAKSLF